MIHTTQIKPTPQRLDLKKSTMCFLGWLQPRPRTYSMLCRHGEFFSIAKLCFPVKEQLPLTPPHTLRMAPSLAGSLGRPRLHHVLEYLRPKGGERKLTNRELCGGGRGRR